MMVYCLFYHNPNTGIAMTLTIEAISAFNDNYIWLITTDSSNRAAVVDPGDAQPVFDVLEERDLILDSILVTHHHKDHIGGITELERETGARVVGPSSEKIPQVTVKVREGDRVNVLGESLQVMEIPGHTLEHIAYFSTSESPPILLCGDTLFAGGCGRMFEGTAPQMLNSLEKLAALPPDTRVYCAHEYTQSNLRFALAVEPGNTRLQARAKAVAELRNHGKSTLPSSITEELATNPFLRCEQATIREAVTAHQGLQPTDKASCFGALRAWKDVF